MNIQLDRAKAIFLDALEIASADDRRAFLDRTCAGDPGLRAEVEELLAHHERIGSFLATVPRDPNATAAPDAAAEGAGGFVGPYRLLEAVGEGGMGLVFVAEQTDPVRRKVALKVIKPGMDTREVVARFEAERQALALMDHPNIARVLDGGTTQSGRPYFVMELVRGAPITDYCDRNHLSVRDRLALFTQVCQAIQHAHQKGVIHRDIKPSNVLITEHDDRPVAKVIDFGVAKAVGAHLTDKSVYTRFMQMIGTPLYMSPEQAGMSGLDVDTRSDIYSLGVLLYELLTGTTPFDRDRFRKAGYDELRRIIREEEPARPSARLSTFNARTTTVSANRGTDPRRLTRLVRGELDWVVMKALEKDRNRRYESAAAFAADMHRYLADEPVEACPPSKTYRLRKFARRNKATLATITAVGLVVLLAAGSVGWTIGWTLNDRRERERRGADEIQRAVAEGRRLQAQRRWPEALALAHHAREVLERTEGQDALRPQVTELIADLEMIRRLENIELRKADASVGSGIGYARPGAEYHPAFRDYGIDVLATAADAVAKEIRNRQIADYLVEALHNWALDERDPATRVRLRTVVQNADPEGILARCRVALDRRDQAELRKIIAELDVGRVPPTTLAILGESLFRSGLRSEAIVWLRAAHARHPGDFWINQNLASAHARTDPPQWDEALRHYTAALAVRPQSHMLYSNIGVALNRLGRPDDARTAWRKSLELQPNYAPAHSNIGARLMDEGKYDQAEAALRQAVAYQPDLAMAHRNLGSLYGRTKRANEALSCYDQAIKLNPDLAEAYAERGMVRATLNELDKAVADLRLALKLNDTLAEAYHGLGSVSEQKKEYAEAVKWYETALRHDPKLVESHYRLGVTYSAWGRQEATSGSRKLSTEKFGKAIDKFNDVIRLNEKNAEAWYSLGNASRDRGQIRAAITAFEKAAALKAVSDDAEYRPHFNLGNVFARLGEYPKAAEAYRAAVTADPVYARAYTSLAAVLAEQGDFAASEKVAATALVRDRHSPEAVGNFAAAIDRQGRYAEALAFLRRHLEKFEGGEQQRAQLQGLIGLYERFVRLQKRLPAFLSGAETPANDEDRLQLGEICIATKDYAAAVKFYREAFAGQPEVVRNVGDGYRFDAARAAACAGSGLDRAAELTAAEQARCRKQALDWLRADLTLWQQTVERGGPPPTALQALRRWQHHTHLAGVRGASIDGLPAEERDDWRRFWVDVDALVKRIPVP